MKIACVGTVLAAAGGGAAVVLGMSGENQIPTDAPSVSPSAQPTSHPTREPTQMPTEVRTCFTKHSTLTNLNHITTIN